MFELGLKCIQEFAAISIQFSCSVVLDTLWPHGLQHTRLPCPSPTHAACSNSCPSSQWCHPAISSSVDPFSSCLQSFPHQGLLWSASSSHHVAKVLELQLQHQWIFRTFNEYSERISFRIDWLDLLAVQGPLKSLPQYHSSKASIFWCSAFFTVQLSQTYMTTEKP